MRSTPAISGRRGVPDERDAFWAERTATHPRFAEAVLADAREAAVKRGERFDHRSTADAWMQVLRLAVVTDAFLALICDRAKAALQRRGVPRVPRLMHRLAMTLGQIFAGAPARVLGTSS